jgi:hypothetical protein
MLVSEALKKIIERSTRMSCSGPGGSVEADHWSI